jgi:hypothetical protein
MEAVARKTVDRGIQDLAPLRFHSFRIDLSQRELRARRWLKYLLD